MSRTCAGLAKKSLNSSKNSSNPSKENFCGRICPVFKIVVFAPKKNTDQIIEAMAAAGAGVIGNYTHNAFITSGFGNWKSEVRNPRNRRLQNRIGLVFPSLPRLDPGGLDKSGQIFHYES